MDPVHPLRAHRRSHGWSLEDVADRLRRLGYETGTRGLGINGTTVGRWEREEQSPRPPYPKLLCRLFEATAVELGLATSPYMPPSDTLDEVERRRLLRLLAGALAAPVLVRGKAGAGGANEPELDLVAHALSRPSGADDAVVSAVESGVAAARRLDDVAGPRVAVELALVQRRVVRTMLMGGPPQSVRAGLTEAAGQLSQFLAWLAYEMNDQSTSLSYLTEALRIAHEVDAHNLGPYVLGHRSVIEVAGGRAQQGMAFIEPARSWAEAKGTAATQSWLAIAEAEARAGLQDRTGGERALERARAAFARSKAEDEPPWMYYYRQASLEGWIGSAYLGLGLADPARRSLNQALVTADASMVRNRAWYLAGLAQTYVLDGEVEETCRLAGKALRIATETRCDREVLRIRELRAQLKPWASQVSVRDLDDQLAATTAWCRPVSV